jgi:carbamoylphosphate synthase large subunit
LDAKVVFYPLKYVLEKRDIFDEDLAIIIKLMPEDLKYPASVKMTDAGVLRDYKIEVAINNQHPETIDQLENLVNRKVIVVLQFLKK